MSKNLWGDLGNIEQMSTPAVVLAEQGSMLSELTKNRLIGNVETEASYKPSLKSYGFSSTLHIVVPGMNNYTYSLLTIDYPIDLYPLVVRNYVDESQALCNTEEELIGKLQEILSSEKVQKVLSTLISL